MTGAPVGVAGARRVPLVLQQTLTDCAPACLAMVFAAHRRPGSLTALRDELGSGRDGVSAAAIREVSLGHGFRYRAARVEAADLRRLPTPFIAHWNADHFVVVDGVGRRRVSIADPALGRRRVSHADFGAAFTGVVQLITPDPSFPMPAGPRPVPPWRQVLTQAAAGQRRALGWVAITSCVLLAAGLAVPALTAALIGQLGSGDGAFLSTVVVAGALLAVAVALLSIGRGFVTSRIQQAVGRNLTGGLVSRLLRAPLLFFEHRGRGDVFSRITSTEAVRDAVATSLVAAVLDAVTAVGYALVVTIVAPSVGVVTVGIAAAQLLVLGALAVRMQRVRREELLAEAHCNNSLMEAVSGIAWLKAAGAEAAIGRTWTGLHEERLAGLLRSSRLSAIADTVAATFRTVGPVVVLVTAAAAAAPTTGQPVELASVGRLVGVVALASAALLPISSLAGHLRSLLEFVSVATHLGDLTSAPAEISGTEPSVVTGTVSVRGLGFRHTARAPWVVRDLDLDIVPGRKIAIVGESGSGKSTIAKLLVGLYTPTTGEVRWDGRPLSALDLPALRRQIGVVLQDPFLVTGTLRDNIALRRPDAGDSEIAVAAAAAEIDQDIARMPAGYGTLVTEGGVGLSGGQRQRIALARALLGDPRLLVLDEATSHIDQATEARIDRHLRSRGVSQVVIAHRLSTVVDADQILVVHDGQIVERGTHDELLHRGGHYAALTGIDHGAMAT